MAMLAETRRRVKLSKDPNNLNWSNDNDKFGKRMMERMGWQKGKGLGAKEDGKVDHIAVKLKNDNAGVGCSKNYADNWIAHQDDFNSLLANLNANHSNSNSGTCTPDAEKVINLENHSKSSKGRVHYKKFTRSKDLSCKNAEDLDCVFGRRKSKSTDKPQLEEKLDKNEAPKGGINDNHNYGVVTTTSKQSVQEYFAQKMAELQRSRAKEADSSEAMNSSDVDKNDASGGSDAGSCCENVLRNEADDSDDRKNGAEMETVEISDETKHTRKRKKEKKKKGKDDMVAEEAGDVEEMDDCSIMEPKKKRRKKDKKEKNISIGLEVEVNDSARDEDTCNKKAKKKKKIKSENEKCVGDEVSSTVVTEGKPGGRADKLTKGVGNTAVESVQEDYSVKNDREVDDDDHERKGKKKKKKRKNEEVTEGKNEEVTEVVNDEESPQKGLKNKSRKQKGVRACESGLEISESNKKRKRNKNTGEETLKKKGEGKRAKMIAKYEKEKFSEKAVSEKGDGKAPDSCVTLNEYSGPKRTFLCKKSGKRVPFDALGWDEFKGSNVLSVPGYRIQK